MIFGCENEVCIPACKQIYNNGHAQAGLHITLSIKKNLRMKGIHILKNLADELNISVR